MTAFKFGIALKRVENLGKIYCRISF